MRKLQKWQEAGLLTEQQAEEIRQYERERHSSNWLRGLTGVGLLAILLGIAALVSANWLHLTPQRKIFGHFVTNLIVIGGYFYAREKQRDGWADGCLVAASGLTLTLMALIGQTYQLEGDVNELIFRWSALTLPFMAVLGRTPLAASAFGVTLMISLWSGLIIDPAEKSIFAISILSAILFWHLGNAAWLQQKRPLIARTLQKQSILLAVLGVMWSLYFARHIGTGSLDIPYYVIAFIMLIGGVFIRRPVAPDDMSTIAFLGTSLVLGLLNLQLLGRNGFHTSADVIIPELIGYAAFWLLFGWWSARHNKRGGIILALYALALRLIALYFETLGDLLNTGFGLIFSGIMILAMVWCMHRLTPRLVAWAKERAQS